jgi:hypothetical protein
VTLGHHEEPPHADSTELPAPRTGEIRARAGWIARAEPGHRVDTAERARLPSATGAAAPHPSPRRVSPHDEHSRPLPALGRASRRRRSREICALLEVAGGRYDRPHRANHEPWARSGPRFFVAPSLPGGPPTSREPSPTPSAGTGFAARTVSGAKSSTATTTPEDHRDDRHDAPTTEDDARVGSNGD